MTIANVEPRAIMALIEHYRAKVQTLQERVVVLEDELIVERYRLREAAALAAEETPHEG